MNPTSVSLPNRNHTPRLNATASAKAPAVIDKKSLSATGVEIERSGMQKHFVLPLP